MPVVIGGDSHKRTHTFVAVDQVGRRLGVKTVPATTDGHFSALTWAQQWSESPVGVRGLPASHAPSRGRHAPRRRRDSPGAAEDDGR